MKKQHLWKNQPLVNMDPHNITNLYYEETALMEKSQLIKDRRRKTENHYNTTVIIGHARSTDGC